jgi:16S rRNA (uracil1498-N3)-methyltransferase
MTAPLFYVDTLPASGAFSIGSDEGRHAVAVLRLKPGQDVLVSDGAGGMAHCTVVTADRTQGLSVEVVRREQRPAPRELTVVQAIPKGERADTAVELMTETGVSRIIPWASARTVADWRGKGERKVERWRRVARAAGKQSRRAYLPDVGDLLEGVPSVPGPALVLHEDAPASLFTTPIPDGPLTVVVGPEGGLTDGEVDAMSQQGAVAVNLGETIMRTSTAAAAACVWIRGFEIMRGTCHDR